MPGTAASFALCLALLLGAPAPRRGWVEAVVENRTPGVMLSWLGTDLMREADASSGSIALLLAGTLVSVDLGRSGESYLYVTASREHGEVLAGYVRRDHLRLTGPAQLPLKLDTEEDPPGVSLISPPDRTARPDLPATAVPLLTARPKSSVKLSMLAGPEAARQHQRRDTMQRWLEWLPTQPPRDQAEAQEMDLLVTILDQLDAHDRQLLSRVQKLERGLEAQRARPRDGMLQPTAGATIVAGTAEGTSAKPAAAILDRKVGALERRLARMEALVERLVAGAGGEAAPEPAARTPLPAPSSPFGPAQSPSRPAPSR